MSIGALAHWRIGAWLRANPYPNQVAEQLVSLGTLEAVELMGLGYPVRIPYDDVRRRYASRLSAIDGVWMLSPKLFTEMMLEVATKPQCTNAPMPQSPNAAMRQCAKMAQ